MKASKRINIIGFIYFVAYIFLAVMYSKERIFLDGTYYFFHVVQSENFRIEHQRFILAAAQFLTWAGSMFHLSLRTLIVLNSITPVIYLGLMFVICLYVLKDLAAAWTLLLAGICGIYFIFFCPMYEVWYGAILLIVFYSFLKNRIYQGNRQLLVLLIIATALLFSYPLMILGFIFCVAYHFIQEKRIPGRGLIILVIPLLLVVLSKVFFISDYESGKISYPYSQIGNTIRMNFADAGNILKLLKFLLTTYGEEMVMAIGTVLILMARKEFLKSVVIFLAIGGFIFLINVTHPQPWNHTNYYERMYLLLVPLCIIPFLQECYLATRSKWLFEIAFIGIILYRGNQVIRHSEVYTARITLIEKLTERGYDKNGSKYYIDGGREEFASLREWSLPMEALIFSSLHHPDHSLVISVKDDLISPDVISKLDSTSFHLRLNEIMKDRDLNSRYFNLEDGTYSELE